MSTNGRLSPRDEANLTAIALIRDAITYSDAAAGTGDVMDTIEPYLQRFWAALGSPEGGFDATDAFTTLFASLAQVAGVAYWKYQEAKHGHPYTKDQVLGSLTEFQSLFLTPDEGETPS